MELFDKKRAYLFWAVLAFLLALAGFAGKLEGKGGGALHPLYSGVLCLAFGCILLYFYFTA